MQSGRSSGRCWTWCRWCCTRWTCASHRRTPTRCARAGSRGTSTTCSSSSTPRRRALLHLPPRHLLPLPTTAAPLFPLPGSPRRARRVLTRTSPAAALRAQLAAIMEVTERVGLGTDNPQLGRLIAARTPYINVLNVSQVEVLRRLRMDPVNQARERSAADHTSLLGLRPRQPVLCLHARVCVCLSKGEGQRFLRHLSCLPSRASPADCSASEPGALCVYALTSGGATTGSPLPAGAPRRAAHLDQRDRRWDAEHRVGAFRRSVWWASNQTDALATTSGR